MGRQLGFRNEAERAEITTRLAFLSTREREVMERVTEGKPNKVIATELGIGEKTVEVHRATDYFKALGRKMGEYMEGRPEVMRLTEV